MNKTAKIFSIIAIISVVGILLYFIYKYLSESEIISSTSTPSYSTLEGNELIPAEIGEAEKEYYDAMMDIIMVPDYSTTPPTTNTAAANGIADLNYDSREDFDNVVEQRITGTKASSNTYKINGVLYSPGALCETYSILGGNRLNELEEKFELFKDLILSVNF